MKNKKILIILSIVIIILSISGCMDSSKKMPKDANPFFVEIEPQIDNANQYSAVSEDVEILPPVVLSTVTGKEKIDIIKDLYPEFYSNLNKVFVKYEEGNLLYLVNIFLNTSVKTDYLFNEELDKQIIKDTQIEILSSIISDNKLTLELKINYVPVLINALMDDKSLETTISDYSSYNKKSTRQTEYFTITFDILKFSKSEGIKVKDYKYKDYILRALTSTMYDSNKTLVEYSQTNKQEDIDNIIYLLKEKDYDNLPFITDTIRQTLVDNEVFIETMINKTSIKSVNSEYYILRYPDIQNSENCDNADIDTIITLLNSNKIKYVKRIIHDEDLNKFYNFISNMMII